MVTFQKKKFITVANLSKGTKQIEKRIIRIVRQPYKTPIPPKNTMGDLPARQNVRIIIQVLIIHLIIQIKKRRQSLNPFHLLPKTAL